VTDQAAQSGVELLCLASYSPNRNAIKSLWELVKKECLSFIHCHNDEELSTAFTRCLEDLPIGHKANRRQELSARTQLPGL
jgi:hypothetical protein